MHHNMIECTPRRFFTMDATDYWPFAQEYSIWNAAVTALQFCMVDLNPLMLNNTIERVYTAFFCSDSAQQLRYISDEILFCHFVTTLNDAFQWELVLEDIGYENGSKSLNIPTLLCQAPWLYNVPTQENLSFGPATPRACPSPASLNTVCFCLTYEDKECSLVPRMEDHSPEEDTLVCHLSSIAEDDENDAKEHFSAASLDDAIWLEEPVQERHLSIHKNSQHDLCPYPCPYSLDLLHLTQEDTLQCIDLSNIFEFPDVMTSASDEDIPSVGRYSWTLRYRQ